MKASLLLRQRVVLTDAVFAELVLWHVPTSVPGSLHHYKYRLALIRNGICIMRYDNESGKGDHRHYGVREHPYSFTSVDTLLEDFNHDVKTILAAGGDFESRLPE
jgi:hypothetical protein